MASGPFPISAAGDDSAATAVNYRLKLRHRHCAYFSAAAGGSKGKGISSSKRRLLLLGAEDHRMDVAAWLQSLGLERYLPAFRDNDIDAEVLPKLTADDLISIGVASVGHRRKLLEAIAALGADGARRGAPRCTGTGRCRTPPADGDVLRSRRLDGAVDAV